MRTLLPSGSQVSADRARRYRAEGWWDSGTLRDGIEAAAARRPGALAVADAEVQLTYEDLARRVASAMAALTASGLRRGGDAVLVTGNAVAGVVCFHALARLGATALLLDRRCGAADVRIALEVLPEAAIIVPTALQERLVGGLERDAVVLEALGADAGDALNVEWSEPDRDTPAAVLLTSGTTARPKAVVHSLNTLTAGAANMARIASANERTVAFLVSPLSSITGVMQVLLAADQHAALVLDDAFDPEESFDRMNDAGATLLGGAPVIAERLLRTAQRRGVNRTTLRTLALGGSMLPRPLLELATDGFGIEIVRVYGSSEAPNFTGSLPGDDRDRRLSDDGALMPGSEVRVGSSRNPNEGMIRGPSLFLGYAGAEDDDAAFEDGWFRTGDLVELQDDRLTVIGRLKAVVDRAGLKISLDEVEAALAGMRGVLEHACFGVPDPSTGERLAVAVLPEADADVTLDDVVRHLDAQGTARRKLPEQLVIWDGPLPRTPSGKVVRSRLVMEAAAKRSDLAERLRG